MFILPSRTAATGCHRLSLPHNIYMPLAIRDAAMPTWASGTKACALAVSESDDSQPATPASTKPPSRSNSSFRLAAPVPAAPTQPRSPPRARTSPAPACTPFSSSSTRAAPGPSHCRTTAASRATTRGKAVPSEHEPWRPAGTKKLRDPREHSTDESAAVKTGMPQAFASTASARADAAVLDARLGELEGKIATLLTDVLVGVEALVDRPAELEAVRQQQQQHGSRRTYEDVQRLVDVHTTSEVRAEHVVIHPPRQVLRARRAADLPRRRSSQPCGTVAGEANSSVGRTTRTGVLT